MRVGVEIRFRENEHVCKGKNLYAVIYGEDRKLKSKADALAV